MLTNKQTEQIFPTNHAVGTEEPHSLCLQLLHLNSHRRPIPQTLQHMAPPVLLQQVLAALHEDLQPLRLAGHHCCMRVAGSKPGGVQRVQVLEGTVLVGVEGVSDVMDHTLVLKLQPLPGTSVYRL